MKSWSCSKIDVMLAGLYSSSMTSSLRVRSPVSWMYRASIPGASCDAFTALGDMRYDVSLEPGGGRKRMLSIASLGGRSSPTPRVSRMFSLYVLSVLGAWPPTALTSKDVLTPHPILTTSRTMDVWGNFSRNALLSLGEKPPPPVSGLSSSISFASFSRVTGALYVIVSLYIVSGLRSMSRAFRRAAAIADALAGFRFSP
jgi:hypothetical protein